MHVGDEKDRCIAIIIIIPSGGLRLDQRRHARAGVARGRDLFG